MQHCVSSNGSILLSRLVSIPWLRSGNFIVHRGFACVRQLGALGYIHIESLSQRWNVLDVSLNLSGKSDTYSILNQNLNLWIHVNYKSCGSDSLNCHDGWEAIRLLATHRLLDNNLGSTNLWCMWLWSSVLKGHEQHDNAWEWVGVAIMVAEQEPNVTRDTTLCFKYNARQQQCSASSIS